MTPAPVAPTSAAIKANDTLADIAVLATEAQIPAVPVPSGSSAGWKFSVWLTKNKNMLKQGVSYISAAFTGLIGMIHVVPTGPWAVIVTALVALATIAVQLGSRFVLDWIDYRYSDSPK